MGPLGKTGCVLIACALVILATVGVLRLTHHYDPAVTCRASQPVYTGTVVTGTWHAELSPGDSVTLPDGDTYTCTARGAYVH
jgi:multisubunit Na+/H+ antiporter MnhG subunit